MLAAVPKTVALSSKAPATISLIQFTLTLRVMKTAWFSSISTVPHHKIGCIVPHYQALHNEGAVMQTVEDKPL
jgi:hypothetical protein